MHVLEDRSDSHKVYRFREGGGAMRDFFGSSKIVTG